MADADIEAAHQRNSGSGIDDEPEHPRDRWARAYAQFETALEAYRTRRLAELYTCCGECARLARTIEESDNWDRIDREPNAPQPPEEDWRG